MFHSDAPKTPDGIRAVPVSTVTGSYCGNSIKEADLKCFGERARQSTLSATEDTVEKGMNQLLLKGWGK